MAVAARLATMHTQPGSGGRSPMAPSSSATENSAPTSPLGYLTRALWRAPKETAASPANS